MKRGVFDKFKQLFSHPYKFFEEVRKERSIIGGFEMFFLASVTALLIQAAIVAVVPLALKMFSPQEYLSFVIANTVFILVSIVGLFLSSLIVHLMIRLMGGQAAYPATFNVFAYSQAPFVLVSFLPVIGFFMGFYTMFLLVVGLMKTHKVGAYRSIAALLIPFLVLGIASIYLLLYLLSLAAV